MKIVGKSRGSSSKIKCFIGQKFIFLHYCIQSVKDRIQIQVQNIINDSSQYISAKVKEKFKKISDSISGKVKKIVAQAK